MFLFVLISHLLISRELYLPILAIIDILISKSHSSSQNIQIEAPAFSAGMYMAGLHPGALKSVRRVPTEFYRLYYAEPRRGTNCLR